MASPYKINIPMYEGPLDLLLDLIKKQEMSIHDIQISKITSQYLDYLHKLEELNVDVSSEFIYMAASLIYIKSKMLLPPDPLASADDPSADPREELVQRLPSISSKFFSKSSNAAKKFPASNCSTNNSQWRK